jgi:GNAT superfamily N-acetyltransferase
MDIQVKEVSSTGVKLYINDENGMEIVRAYLYIIHNDLHERPFGLMEDVFVVERFRSQGLGKQIVQTVVEEAKKRNCYKLIGTSRFSREKVHEFYEKAGFYKRGYEFRMDFKKE